MEIRRWLCFVLIKCALLQYIDAKSVSLNEIIAAESQLKQQAELTPKLRIQTTKDSRAKPSLLHKITADSEENQYLDESSTRKISGLPKRLSLSKRLAPHAIIKKDKKGNTIAGDKIISPLRYRKTFQIKSPLKPKKLKLALKSRFKRKNQSTKREISGNEGLRHKYIPLLKSLTMLVDNLFNTDESDSDEIKRKSYKRNKYYFEEQYEPSFERSSISSSRKTNPRSQKKTTTPSPSISTEISPATEGFTYYENYDHSTYRSHKSVPVLLPRNTFSVRRDDHGPSERSSTPHNRYFEGDITRYHGDYEHNPGCAENESCEESDENDTHSVTRNDPSGLRYTRTSGNGVNTRNSEDRKVVANVTSKNENSDDAIGANQFEVRRNKTESEDFLREPVRKLRGSIPEDEVSHDERIIPEPTRYEEAREKSVLNTTKDSAGDQRIAYKDGSFTTEDEKIRTGNERVMTNEKNSRQIENSTKTTEKKRPVVLIFDGYSVTRDKNGENKVSGKTIHIRS